MFKFDVKKVVNKAPQPLEWKSKKEQHTIKSTVHDSVKPKSKKKVKLSANLKRSNVNSVVADLPSNRTKTTKLTKLQAQKPSITTKKKYKINLTEKPKGLINDKKNRKLRLIRNKLYFKFLKKLKPLLRLKKRPKLLATPRRLIKNMRRNMILHKRKLKKLKKLNVCWVKKIFRPKKYSSLVWHFFFLFVKKKKKKKDLLVAKFYYLWNFQTYFQGLKKFSVKSKLKFLLLYLFRYKINLKKVNSFKNLNFFFVNKAKAKTKAKTKAKGKYFNVTNFNLQNWIAIFNNFIFFKYKCNILLNIYISYIMRTFKHEVKYFSVLPFVNNTLFAYHNFFEYISTNMCIDTPNILCQKQIDLTLINFINVRIFKKLKIYFYCWYKVWYRQYCNNAYLQFLKYIFCLPSKNKYTLYKNTFKVLNFNRIFFYFDPILDHTNKIVINENLVNFNFLVFKYICLLFDNVIALQKYKLYLNLKKLKYKFMRNKKSEYLLFKKLLELYLIKQKSGKWVRINLFFKKWINTVSFAQSKSKRLLYAVRSFFYHKFNKMPESDSIFKASKDNLSAVINKKTHGVKKNNNKNNNSDYFKTKKTDFSFDNKKKKIHMHQKLNWTQQSYHYKNKNLWNFLQKKKVSQILKKKLT